MDASQYNDYVLVLLFVEYVSDKAASQASYLLDVPEGARFADMVALQGDKEIGDKMNKIISKLAEANELKGVIDVADFNDADKLGKGKEMVDRLSKLVAIFDSPNLDFSANRAEGDDLLGDAYEYLMRHFATESGKSKGQFYTPAEVSRVMAKVVGVGSAKNNSQTIVEGCTDAVTVPKPPWRGRKEKYIAHLKSADASTILVSASDKVYNARAILRDLRRHGDKVFNRFTEKKEGTLWYYRSLVTAFRRARRKRATRRVGQSRQQHRALGLRLTKSSRIQSWQK